jgi:hypothetical protein
VSRAALSAAVLGLALTVSAPARAAIFEVVELRGDVLALPAFASSWSTLERGDRVAEDTLVQARTAAFIAVKGVKQDDGAVPSGFTLSIKQSMITRLGPETRRVGEVVGYFPSFSDHVGGAKEAKKEDDPEKKDPEENDGYVRSAWERVASLFGETVDAGKEAEREASGVTGASMTAEEKTLALVREEDAKVGDEFEPLTMVFPKSGQSFLVETLPTGLAATWEPAGKGLTYRVVLRREDAGTFRVLGETSEVSLRFKVDAPGHYYLKVETTDGRFRSKNQLFVVTTFEGMGEFEPARKKEKEMPPVEMR